MFMRSLIVFLIVMAGFAVYQSDRNNCSWYGVANWANWVVCVGTVRW